MAYEEKVHGDRLCWRMNPSNEWVPFAASELTTMVVDYRYRMEIEKRSMEVLKREIGALIQEIS